MQKHTSCSFELENPNLEDVIILDAVLEEKYWSLTPSERRAVAERFEAWAMQLRASADELEKLEEQGAELRLERLPQRQLEGN
jgi:hypothetical protein